MIKTLKVWFFYSTSSYQQAFASRTAAVLMLLGKIIRILVFASFLVFLLQGTKGLIGYTPHQVIFFYLTFNLIDTLGQVFFREVYRFRQLVIEGNLDSVLTKPVNPLIRVLLGGTDLLDTIMLFILIFVISFYGVIYISTNPMDYLIYVLLILNAFMLSAAFHIFVLGFAVIFLSVDHIIFMYRDMTSLLRVPVDIYKEPLRGVITFLIPLGIMYTFPAKALMGVLNPVYLIISFGIGGLFLLLALWFWKYSLRYYQSASS